MDLLTAILADPNVGDDFKSALRKTQSGEYTLLQLQRVAENATPVRRAKYVAALIRMDWTFEASDDQRVRRAGRDELERLREEREQIDPDHVLWKRHAHEDYRHG